MRVELILYFDGKSDEQQKICSKIDQFCRDHIKSYQLTKVDIRDEKQSALKSNIFVTPTLIKIRPLPLRKIIGGIDNTRKLLIALDLLPA